MAVLMGHSQTSLASCLVTTAGVGTVVKAGAGADKFKPGQRVSALGWPASQGEGSFQEYVNVKVEKLVRCCLQCATVSCGSYEL